MITKIGGQLSCEVECKRLFLGMEESRGAVASRATETLRGPVYAYLTDEWEEIIQSG